MSVDSDYAGMQQVLKGHFSVAVLIYSTHHPIVTPEQLAERWVVGIHATKDIIKVTTQVGASLDYYPLHGRYRT